MARSGKASSAVCHSGPGGGRGWLTRRGPAFGRRVMRTPLMFALVPLLVFAQLVTTGGRPTTTVPTWTMWMGALDHPDSNFHETAITPDNVNSLSPAWAAPATGSGSISTQPLVADGLIYYGSWSGDVVAVDPATGNTVWSVATGFTTQACPTRYTDWGILATPVYRTIPIHKTHVNVLFVAGGAGAMYALYADAQLPPGVTNRVLWETQLGPNPNPPTMLMASPVLFKGSVYEGTSTGNCPNVQQKFFKMDVQTGKITATWATTPDGCNGVAIWSGPAVDSATSSIFVATANPGKCSAAATTPFPDCTGTEPYEEAVVKLNAADLSVEDCWQVPASQQEPDGDFGASPVLMDPSNGAHLLAVPNKNGILYVLNRNSLTSGPVWEMRLGTGTTQVASAAWDGTNLYVAGGPTTLQDGTTCKNASLYSLQGASGAINWERCLPRHATDPPFLTPGLVFLGDAANIVAFSATGGTQEFAFHDPAGGPTDLFLGPPVVIDGRLYEGNMDGNLWCLGLPSSS
jgi:outer membrane protein assembly factor BamB